MTTRLTRHLAASATVLALLPLGGAAIASDHDDASIFFLLPNSTTIRLVTMVVIRA